MGQMEVKKKTGAKSDAPMAEALDSELLAELMSLWPLLKSEDRRRLVGSMRSCVGQARQDG